MDNNTTRKLVYSLGDELDNFIESMKSVKNSVYIAYCVERRHYGAKVVLTVRDRASYSTVLHVVSKIRSDLEIPMVQVLLHGVKRAVYKYIENTCDSESSE